jgi:hypothetical protein
VSYGNTIHASRKVTCVQDLASRFALTPKRHRIRTRQIAPQKVDQAGHALAGTNIKGGGIIFTTKGEGVRSLGGGI